MRIRTTHYNLTQRRLEAIADDVAFWYYRQVVEFHSQPVSERSADRIARLSGPQLSDALYNSANRFMWRHGYSDFHVADNGFCSSAWEKLAVVTRRRALWYLEGAVKGLFGSQEKAAVIDWAERHRAARNTGAA